MAPRTVTDSPPTAKRRLGYAATQLLVRTTFRLLFGLRIIGADRVPRSGAFILTSNHQSWFDPPIVGSSCPREIFYAAKKELFETPILRRLVRYYNSIPVRRTGFDRALLARLGELLDRGYPVIIFPEGTRFLDGNLHPPKLGVGMVASGHLQAPIIPVYVSGSARLGRQLWQRRLRITFGEPYRLGDAGLGALEGKAGYQAVANEVMRHIATIGGVSAPKPQCTDQEE